MKGRYAGSAWALAGAGALAILVYAPTRRVMEPDAIVVSVPDLPELDIEAQSPAARDGLKPAGAASAPSVPVPDTAARPPPHPDAAAVREAVAAYRRGDGTAGDAIRAGLKEPAARAVLDWAAIRFGGSRVSFEHVMAFLAANPDWPGRAAIRRRAEEELVSERKPATLVREFFAAEKPQTPSGKLALALALRADRRGAEADALIRESWRGDTFGRELETRVLAEFGEVLKLPDHRFRLERAMFRENWDGARRAADYAGKGYDALVKARVAVDGSAGNAAKLLDAVPAALKREPGFLFARVQFLRRADKEDEAAKLLPDVPADAASLVDGDEWWTERRLVARKLLDRGNAAAAYAVLSTNVALSTEKRIEAEFHAGWVALRFLNDPKLATTHFDRAAEIARTPISLARAAYWQGRAAEAAGAAVLATAAFERAAEQGITYYGQLAADRLGRSSPHLRLAAATAGGPERSRAADALTTRVFGLIYDAGLRDLAMPLMNEFGRQGGDVAALDAAGEVALANRDPRALLALGKAATQRGLPLDEHAFPIIGVPAFEPVGPRVEPAMVHAIARQESAFDPAAGSSAGARGLMQLMPATARATARKFGVEFDGDRLTDAVYNARLGAAHLGELMETWKGSHILVFASYNAGPGNVKKWIDAYGDPRRPEVDAVDWVERIPFSETRNYVQRVSENLHVYRKRLAERTARSGDRDATGTLAVR